MIPNPLLSTRTCDTYPDTVLALEINGSPINMTASNAYFVFTLFTPRLRNTNLYASARGAYDATSS